MGGYERGIKSLQTRIFEEMFSDRRGDTTDIGGIEVGTTKWGKDVYRLSLRDILREHKFEGDQGVDKHIHIWFCN